MHIKSNFLIGAPKVTIFLTQWFEEYQIFQDNSLLHSSFDIAYVYCKDLLLIFLIFSFLSFVGSENKLHSADKFPIVPELTEYLLKYLLYLYCRLFRKVCIHTNIWLYTYWYWTSFLLIDCPIRICYQQVKVLR